MTRQFWTKTMGVASAVLGAAVLVGCGSSANNAQNSGTPPTATSLTAQSQSPVERGKYLVTVGGCNDCHTPKIMGPNGPALDTSKLLSGHPEGMRMPAPPQLPPGSHPALLRTPRSEKSARRSSRSAAPTRCYSFSRTSIGRTTPPWI